MVLMQVTLKHILRPTEKKHGQVHSPIEPGGHVEGMMGVHYGEG